MKLKKSLKLIDLYCIATGAMISSGLFILPGLAHAQAGPAVVLSYFIAGLLALMGMLSQAELVSAMPKAGGTYFYVTRSMGPAVGTIDGLFTWISLSLKSSFALFGMAAFTTILFGVEWKVVGFILCLVFVVINILGIESSSRIQNCLVFGLLAILAVYIIKGLPSVSIHNLEPLMPNGYPSVFAVAGMVFVAYGGLLKVASMAEEVKDPAQTIPQGMILSLITVVLIYSVTVYVTTGVLRSEQLDLSLAPLSDGAAMFLGRPGRMLLSPAAILAFISTANAGIMAASRYPLALARDGLIPEQLARIHPRFQTPHIAIMTTGTMIMLSLLLPLTSLVKLASTVLMITFVFSCLCVIIMRESHLQNYEPRFFSPLYPWVQLAGILGGVVMLVLMGRDALTMFAALVLGSLFLFWFYGRIRSTREYALLHLIQRITAKELTTRSLETELKEIIRERDDITKDRFDHVIEDSMVLDIKHPLGVYDFFKQVAQALSQHLKASPEVILKQLLDREAESSTVIGFGIAIPHIIVEGKKAFDILLARCKPGIDFNLGQDKVHTVFVLVGSKDERNFHLRALSAIAQIAQGHDFQKKWLAAKSKEALKDVVLLGKRVR